MARLRYVDLSGTVGSGGLTSSATSHTFTAPLTYANGTTVPTLSGSDYFLLSILNAAGDAVSEVVKVTAYNSGTGAATIVRGQEGTTGVSHASGDKVLLSDYPSDLNAMPGAIIGITHYNPSGAAVTVTTTSATFSDIDATNLAVSFVVPPSGQVLVRLNCFCSAAASTTYDWGLREGSTPVTGADAIMAFGLGSGQLRETVEFLITGLTPGAPKTWKWAHRLSSGSGASGVTYGNNNAAPATMTVLAA